MFDSPLDNLAELGLQKIFPGKDGMLKCCHWAKSLWLTGCHGYLYQILCQPTEEFDIFLQICKNFGPLVEVEEWDGSQELLG